MMRKEQVNHKKPKKEESILSQMKISMIFLHSLLEKHWDNSSKMTTRQKR